MVRLFFAILLFRSALGLTPQRRWQRASFMTLEISPTTSGGVLDRRPRKMEWKSGGYCSWKWNGHEVNYVAKGTDKPGTPLVLIHGFGASVYHWRHQLPELSEDRPVYALDMLGFGLSDKPLVDYSASLWRDQVGAFLDEVVVRKAVVTGNSLGGFTALYVASTFPDRVSGCILLNAAGRFAQENAEATAPETEDDEPGLMAMIGATIQKAVIYGAFFVTKQPARISQVLKQVYPVDPTNVDDTLVESIRFPADTSPNCAEVFYRVITKNGAGPAVTIDELLPTLTAANIPLSLVWGEYDPWIRPAAADRIQMLKPDTQRISINAGHCPHDESPTEVNAALSEIMAIVDGQV